MTEQRLRPLIAKELSEQAPEIILQGFEATPFHKHLDLQFALMADWTVMVRVHKKQELLGNVTRNMMHGGVIAAAFDSVGGAVVTMNVYRKYLDLPIEERAKKLWRICTIDLSTNYLAPAKEDDFDFSARIVKLGSTIANVDMQMHSSNGDLIATANGNFMV